MVGENSVFIVIGIALKIIRGLVGRTDGARVRRLKNV